MKLDRYHRSRMRVSLLGGNIITPNTEIRIWFDSSGSMDTTLSPLLTMRDENLKQTLLPYYNNDSDLYDEKVTVTSWASERTFERIAIEPPILSDGIIHLVFQDEASPIYHASTSSFNGSRTATYDSDMAALRDKLVNTFPENKYQAVIFQVQGSSGFKSFLEAVEDGTGNYSPPNGLSDRAETSFVYDVIEASTPEYYAGLIEDAVL